MNGYTNGLAAAHSGTSTPIDSYSESAQNEAGSSTAYQMNGFSRPPYRSNHNEDIVNHLYHSGFQNGNYADTVLHVHQNAYQLHAIILSRSPFLAHLMSTSPATAGQRTVYIPLDREPEVTNEGIAIALGYLYSSVSLSLIRPENARGVLAAGCLLGGMEELCQFAYDVCRHSITLDNIGSWLEFLDTLPPAPPSPTEASSPVPHPIPVFGSYAQRLRDDVFQFLVVTLPEILDVHATSQETLTEPAGKDGRDVLLQIFSRVPFEMFKAAVESPTFQIGSDHSRFQFAKDAIAVRKRGIARGSGAEETVVLAFGANNFGGSAVHVTRKMRKRPLWKVNP